VALAGLAVEVHAGRGVEPALAEVHALEVRAADDLLKRHAVPRRAAVPHEAVLEDDVVRRRGDSVFHVREDVLRTELREPRA
jgi:hypothetical protein